MLTFKLLTLMYTKVCFKSYIIIYLIELNFMWIRRRRAPRALDLFSREADLARGARLIHILWCWTARYGVEQLDIEARYRLLDFANPVFGSCAACRAHDKILPYDVGPARVFLGEAEKTPWFRPCIAVWFRPCIAGQDKISSKNLKIVDFKSSA